MLNLLNYPFLVFGFTFLFLWLAGRMGARMRSRSQAMASDDVRMDFSVIQTATLTLLGLIIGFSFSLATGRYDQRKNYEEAEANAIGTEYVRTDLMSREEAARVKELLKEYTAQRVKFYSATSKFNIDQIREDTAKIQDKLWAALATPANEDKSAVRAIVLMGMNDVLNSEGYTQAAWWYRIPPEAWALMIAIALFSAWMVGFGARRHEPRLLLVLPLVVAVAFFLIADIDSPRGGAIRVAPLNLIRLQAGLK
jgi:hypothetical protein